MQQMRAAQKSDPDLFGETSDVFPESHASASLTQPIRNTTESQVVERVVDEAPEPISEDRESTPFFSAESGSSHPVHVNPRAFGPPAIVIQDSSPSSDDVLIEPDGERAVSVSGIVSTVSPATLRRTAPRSKRTVAFAGLTAAATVAATAAWWLLAR